MKKIIPIILLGAIAVLCGCNKISSKHYSKETQSNDSATTNWAAGVKLVKYENSLYSFVYPETWDSISMPEYDTDIYVGEKDAMFGFSVMHIEDINKSLGEILEGQLEAYELMGWTVVDNVKTEVDGIPAYRITAVSQKEGIDILRNISYIFVKDNIFYNIRFGNEPRLVKENSERIDNLFVDSFKLKTKINRKALGVELGMSESEMCRALKSQKIQYNVHNSDWTDRECTCKNVVFAGKQWNEMCSCLENDKVHAIMFFVEDIASSYGSSLSVTYFDWLKETLDHKYSGTDVKFEDNSTDLTYDKSAFYYDGETLLKLHLTGDKDKKMTCSLVYQDIELAQPALSKGTNEL